MFPYFHVSCLLMPVFNEHDSYFSVLLIYELIVVCLFVLLFYYFKHVGLLVVFMRTV